MKSLVLIKIFLSLILGIFILGGFSNFALAQQTNPGSIIFNNPLQKDTVDGLLLIVLDNLRAIIVVLALVFIVVGALLYITSAGNESRMTMAKGAIVAAVIGLAIGIAAPSFLHEIYSVLGNTVPAEISSSPRLSEIALNVLNFLLSIVGIVAIIMLVAAGIAYLTAAGNEGQIETAKKMTTWAIVGIAVALGAMVIVKQLTSFFL